MVELAELCLMLAGVVMVLSLPVKVRKSKFEGFVEPGHFLCPTDGTCYTLYDLKDGTLIGPISNTTNIYPFGKKPFLGDTFYSGYLPKKGDCVRVTQTSVWTLRSVLNGSSPSLIFNKSEKLSDVSHPEKVVPTMEIRFHFHC